MGVISESERAEHLRWLLELTQLPTAAGREQRVIDWIKSWVAQRPVLRLREDHAGNLEIRAATDDPAALSPPHRPNPPRPLYFTAHLDHPAFVVERIVAPGVLELSFRGGVMDDYFARARVAVNSRAGTSHLATVGTKLEPPAGEKPRPLAHYLAELDDGGHTDRVAVGDIATWDLPGAGVIDGILHTNACDDLAAAAAALAAMDVLLTGSLAPAHGGDGSDPADSPSLRHSVTSSLPPPTRALPRLLFTRAEEVGFIGAIAACRPEPGCRTMPMDARVIALENSRAFADSPIGAGPIVRVGDRLSIFSPSLTDAIAKRAEHLAGGPPPTASQKAPPPPKWKWQRKLMAGGACEASVFCGVGYEATCVCLPLGNYHNMADLEAVQAGKNISPARVGREYISLSDFHGLVDLLVACGESLPDISPVHAMVEKLWAERSFVLEQPG